MRTTTWENGPKEHIVQGGPLLINTLGTPIVSERVLEDLKRIDPRLTVEWMPGAWGTSSFVLKKQWAENDRRWECVQRGETPREKAFDIEHRFPPDCSSDSMASYVAARYGERNIPKDPRKEAERLIAEAARLNRIADEQQVEQIVEDGTRKALDDSDHQRLLVLEHAVGGTHERAHPMIVNDGPKRLL